jgi:methyl-accepting chemotaxis protein
MTSPLRAPLELVRALGEAVQALMELPTVLERNLRETNGLIAEARAQLELLGEQARRMTVQLDAMAAVTDGLLEGTKAIAAAAQDVRRQMEVTTEQLAATNRTLEQLVRFAEPLDRVGKRMAEGFQRVTGRGRTSGESAE